MQTVTELNKIGYVHRHKAIRFNGASVPMTPERLHDYMDRFDRFFPSLAEYQKWNKSVTAGLAELDESMNYCTYFVRTKGNDGNYVRDGKSFPVNGLWTGIQDFDNFPPCQPFVRWLEENGWRSTWFELMDRYKYL